MTSRSVVITGLGPVSALGVGMDATWKALLEGTSAIAPIQNFDASNFACTIGGEVRQFKINDYVPKSYRKATKVMARDIELAVAAADQAARDAKLTTKGTEPASEPGRPGPGPSSYPSSRMGCHIGAGLIACDLDELTDALAHAKNEEGKFELRLWGSQGMSQLTPLWLLKYLPNMLACHVTIIHDLQGPSNTITCAESSGNLSIGESLRVIQRGAADLCFCGGSDTKLNPMGYLRQAKADRLCANSNDQPTQAVKSFSQNASGTVLGEGGGIVILESRETFDKRKEKDNAKAYAQILGFGSSQSVNVEDRNLWPDKEGRGIALAITAALKEAQISPDEIDLIIPMGLGIARTDQAEANALTKIFGARLASIPLVPLTPFIGNTVAGAGAIAVCVAARALVEQTIPPTINCDNPLPGLLAGTAAARPAKLRHVLTYSASFGGQNAALILKKYEA